MGEEVGVVIAVVVDLEGWYGGLGRGGEGLECEDVWGCVVGRAVMGSNGIGHGNGTFGNGV